MSFIKKKNENENENKNSEVLFVTWDVKVTFVQSTVSRVSTEISIRQGPHYRRHRFNIHGLAGVINKRGFLIRFRRQERGLLSLASPGYAGLRAEFLDSLRADLGVKRGLHLLAGARLHHGDVALVLGEVRPQHLHTQPGTRRARGLAHAVFRAWFGRFGHRNV